MTAEERDDPDTTSGGDDRPATDLPSAADLKKVITDSERHKQDERRRLDREIEEKKKAELEALRQPVRISEDEIRDLTARFRTAAEQGLTEFVVYSFPAGLLDDGGRAINNGEPDWPASLVGRPRAYHEAWQAHLQDKGYRMIARVANFDADGMISDIELVAAW